MEDEKDERMRRPGGYEDREDEKDERVRRNGR
jgi:hypothetical protein